MSQRNLSLSRASDFRSGSGDKQRCFSCARHTEHFAEEVVWPVVVSVSVSSVSDCIVLAVPCGVIKCGQLPVWALAVLISGCCSGSLMFECKDMAPFCKDTGTVLQLLIRGEDGEEVEVSDGGTIVVFDGEKCNMCGGAPSWFNCP